MKINSIGKLAITSLMKSKNSIGMGNNFISYVQNIYR